MEVIAQNIRHSRIGSRLVIILERIGGHHPWPPVIVRSRSDITVSALVIEHPIHPFLRFLFEAVVVESVCKRNEPFIVIRTTLPTLAFAAKPATVGAEIIGIKRLSVASETVALQLALCEQPALRPYAAKWQGAKWRGQQRRTVGDDGSWWK